MWVVLYKVVICFNNQGFLLIKITASVVIENCFGVSSLTEYQK